MTELKYSDLLRSLANQLDKNEDNISEICPTLLEIIFNEMSLKNIFSFISSKYVGR